MAWRHILSLSTTTEIVYSGHSEQIWDIPEKKNSRAFSSIHFLDHKQIQKEKNTEKYQKLEQ